MSKAKVNIESTEGIVLRRRQLFEEMPRKKAREGDILPPDPSIVPIDVAGDLHKLGRVFRTWVKRYFEVQGTRMYYYKNDQKKFCLGYIDLMRCHFIGRSSLASFGCPFELQTGDRTHVLAARTESDMKQWISVVKTKLLPEASKREKKATKSEKIAAAAAAAAAATAVSVEPSFQTRRATVKRHRSFMSSRMHRTNLSSVSSQDQEEEEEKSLKSQTMSSVADNTAVHDLKRPASTASDELPASLDVPVASLPCSSSFNGFESTTVAQLDDGHDLLGQQAQMQTKDEPSSIEQETATGEVSLSQPLPEMIQFEVPEQPAPVEVPPSEEPASVEAQVVQQPSVEEDPMLEQAEVAASLKPAPSEEPASVEAQVVQQPSVEEDPVPEQAEVAASLKPAQLTVTEASVPEPELVVETPQPREQEKSTMELKPATALSEEPVVEAPVSEQLPVEPQEVTESLVSEEVPAETQEDTEPFVSEQLPVETQAVAVEPEHLQEEIVTASLSSELPQPATARSSSPQQLLKEQESLPMQPEQVVDILPSVQKSLEADVSTSPEQLQHPTDTSSLPMLVVTGSASAQAQQQTKAPKQVEAVTEGTSEASPQVDIRHTRSHLQMQQQQRLLMEEQQRLGKQQVKGSTTALGEESSAIQQLRALLEVEQDSFSSEPSDIQDQPWLQEQNPIDQLKHFLRVCA